MDLGRPLANSKLNTSLQCLEDNQRKMPGRLSTSTEMSAQLSWKRGERPGLEMWDVAEGDRAGQVQAPGRNNACLVGPFKLLALNIDTPSTGWLLTDGLADQVHVLYSVGAH